MLFQAVMTFLSRLVESKFSNGPFGTSETEISIFKSGSAIVILLGQFEFADLTIMAGVL